MEVKREEEELALFFLIALFVPLRWAAVLFSCHRTRIIVCLRTSCPSTLAGPEHFWYSYSGQAAKRFSGSSGEENAHGWSLFFRDYSEPCLRTHAIIAILVSTDNKKRKIFIVKSDISFILFWGISGRIFLFRYFPLLLSSSLFVNNTCLLKKVLIPVNQPTAYHLPAFLMRQLDSVFHYHCWWKHKCVLCNL